MSEYVDPDNDSHVSFPCDDHALGEGPRLHILGVLDYYVSVGPGIRLPMGESVRARTSGERDPCVTMLIATLWRYGKGDYEGAAACARTFIEQMVHEHGAPLAKDAAEQALDEIAKLCGCPQWQYPARRAPEAERFYLLDIRTVVGNCALWWCPDGKGYTCELDKAGLYSRDEAHRHRDTDIPIPKAFAQKLVCHHVRLDHLRQHMEIPYPKTEGRGRKRRTG